MLILYVAKVSTKQISIWTKPSTKSEVQTSSCSICKVACKLTTISYEQSHVVSMWLLVSSSMSEEAKVHYRGTVSKSSRQQT